ncbi:MULTISPECIES: hypothetical protein [Enterococcus]|uniref:DNA-directed RNA polymerase beta subunit n=1 Tax=Enterococcus faecium TaxID=1352 RepID=A0A0D5MBC1_ENTFC|nr:MULTISPECIES: hypothetical protein [Enterococcus]AJY53486.1 hypothetical protein pEfm12493_002 [Enterococcus faecium]MEC3942700.1 hypothetical protein [Enterococcus mundtii]
MIDCNDRGRLKWAGFYLSDHTEKIDADVEQRANQNLAKEQMTTEEITEVLNAAVLKRKTVCIQKEERDSEGYYPDDIIGKIRGHDELGIFVGDHKVHYDEVRHVEIQELDKWSQL